MLYLLTAAVLLMLGGCALYLTDRYLLGLALCALAAIPVLACAVINGWDLWVQALIIGGETMFFVAYVEEAIRQWRDRREEVAG